MTTSVIIPVYNGSRTIRATLDSVLEQTLPADEILVMDDGSTDDTFSLLKSYSPRIVAFQQENRGVAAARNALCDRASGDLIAFLDSDDLWHPRYLEHQRKQFTSHPGAVAFFAGVVNFFGHGNYEWNSRQSDPDTGIEVLDALSFFERLTTVSGRFVAPSLFCVPRRVLAEIGREPFREKISGVDDCYFTRRLALLGDVVISPTVLVAYRTIEGSLSENKLNACRLMVECCRALEEHYRPRRELYGAFKMAFASEKRQYAKRLMGAGLTKEARREILSSLLVTSDPVSLGKSLGFLFVSYMPAALQPKWPPPRRERMTGDGNDPPSSGRRSR